MQHTHDHLNSRNMLLGRVYLGDGRYKQRGVCQDVDAGDTFVTQQCPGSVLTFDVITEQRDAKGVFLDESLRTNAYYEAIMTDGDYKAGEKYTPIFNIPSP